MRGYARWIVDMRRQQGEAHYGPPPGASTMQEKELLTTEELARRLRVAPATIRSWARRGCIPTLRLSPKVIRYDAEAVLAALSTTPAKGGGK